MGLLCIAFGAFMNLKYGKKLKYDLILIISSLYSMAVATRQVFLHIMPGDSGYGSKFLNLHFYTWNDIISFLFIILISISPIFKNISVESLLSKISLSIKKTVNLFFILFLALLVTNVILVYLECGLKQCPDNPITYKY